MRYIICKSMRGWLVLAFNLLMLGATSGNAAEAYSDLWGQDGEKWTSQSRLPDASFAGYQCGEKPIPDYPVAANVRDFGAKGDGTTDDTKAFNDAIAKTASGAILVPEGIYKITNFVKVNKSNVVLRGEGEKTIIDIPVTLTDVQPNWGATTGGKRTSNWSWYGGFLMLTGSIRAQNLASISAVAKRGDTWIAISTVSGISAGQWVQVQVSDDASKTLTKYLYSDETGSISSLGGRRTTMASRVKSVDASGKRVELDRPLRFETRASWNPTLTTFEPSVTNSGIEKMTVRFPSIAYPGEFNELGYNGFQLEGVAHCWIRNITLVNAECGIFTQGGAAFNTLGAIVLTATKPVYSGSKYNTAIGCVGHHAISICSPDNRITEFDYQANYVHDLSVQGSAACGNVFDNGRGLDICFDHHKECPYANVYSNIDAGDGNRLFRSGGGADIGRNSGGWETFWNIRTKADQTYPTKSTFGVDLFGPSSMNFVGLTASGSSIKDINGTWWEVIKPADLSPQNIYEAQLQKRIGNVAVDFKTIKKTVISLSKVQCVKVYSLSGKLLTNIYNVDKNMSVARYRLNNNPRITGGYILVLQTASGNIVKKCITVRK